jgi:L-ascorbate metabolism protein UlaG (beta-lactamase superfamily)
MRLTEAGFTDVRPIETAVTWEGLTITRAGGQHGRGENAQRLGPVAGWVLSRAGSPTVYLAGDTVWCPDVADAIRTHNPEVILVFSGAARPNPDAGTIIMDVEDVVSTCQAAPRATIIAAHMNALDFCTLSRNGLRAGLSKASVKSTVLIPEDGQELHL